ncbi:MAG: cupin domain-containing protein [Vulcanococcus sp.]
MGNNDPSTALSYWHLWRDDDGISRQTYCELTGFEFINLGPRNTPLFNRVIDDNLTATAVILPVGWKASWHENPAPKLIYVLKGSWAITSMDGQRVVVGPGEFSFGGDQNCTTDAEGRNGHISEQLGDEPCIQLAIQPKDDRCLNAKPGWLNPPS